MASSMARTAAFFCGFIAFFGVTLTCGMPYWKVSNWQSSDGLFGRIPAFDGIWWHCMSLKAGGFSCNNHGKPLIYSDGSV